MSFIIPSAQLLQWLIKLGVRSAIKVISGTSTLKYTLTLAGVYYYQHICILK